MEMRGGRNSEGEEIERLERVRNRERERERETEREKQRERNRERERKVTELKPNLQRKLVLMREGEWSEGLIVF